MANRKMELELLVDRVNKSLFKHNRKLEIQARNGSVYIDLYKGPCCLRNLMAGTNKECLVYVRGIDVVFSIMFDSDREHDLFFREEFPDHPLPEWACRISKGAYMEPGAQLRTRDGRAIGNAYVDSVHLHEKMKCVVAVCYTDAGSELTFTKEEMKERFYPPIFVMKLNEARKKFRRKTK